MTAQTLRELAREYAKGTLDRESYRRNRAALIDGILSGAIPVPPIDYAAPVATRANLDTTHPGKRRKTSPAESEVDEMDFFDITQVVTPTDVTPPRQEPILGAEESGTTQPESSRAIPPITIAIVIAIAVFAIAGLGFGLFSGNSDADGTAPSQPARENVSQSPPPPDAAPDAGAEAAPPVDHASIDAAGVGNDAIVEFLRTKNWSDENLDQFTATWNALAPADREAAAGSGEMLQMGNAIYRRLLEVRALAQVSAGNASTAKQDRLLEFARMLGIDDPRLSPEPAAPIPTE